MLLLIILQVNSITTNTRLPHHHRFDRFNIFLIYEVGTAITTNASIKRKVPSSKENFDEAADTNEKFGLASLRVEVSNFWLTKKCSENQEMLGWWLVEISMADGIFRVFMLPHFHHLHQKFNRINLISMPLLSPYLHFLSTQVYYMLQTKWLLKVRYMQHFLGFYLMFKKEEKSWYALIVSILGSNHFALGSGLLSS
uniref:Uncharacterized protein n=1 Tax=Lactuca sativa TaxID=4236 RepID=A0A9R1VQ99_LACSA|nr:hypothetical protein LSAT_V11C400183950 [Lactuca sativa]